MGRESSRTSRSISDDRRTIPGRPAGGRSFDASRSNFGPPARHDKPAGWRTSLTISPRRFLHSSPLNSHAATRLNNGSRTGSWAGVTAVTHQSWAARSAGPGCGGYAGEAPAGGRERAPASVYRRLGVAGRSQAVARARELGLLN